MDGPTFSVHRGAGPYLEWSLEASFFTHTLFREYLLSTSRSVSSHFFDLSIRIITVRGGYWADTPSRAQSEYYLAVGAPPRVSVIASPVPSSLFRSQT